MAYNEEKVEILLKKACGVFYSPNPPSGGEGERLAVCSGNYF